MSTNRKPNWSFKLEPPSQADHASHPNYFKQNAEAPPTAVLVFHGIGEEVRFETLSRAASLILEEALQRGATIDPVVVRSVPRDSDAKKLEVRSELSWTEVGGTQRQVHVYEAYWAPLTAGKVTYWETMGFLASAGWNGLRGTIFSGERGFFKRWLFGDFWKLEISSGTVPMLVVLIAMMGFVAAIIALAASALAGVLKQIADGGSHSIENAFNFVYQQVAVPWNGFIHLIAGLAARFHAGAQSTGLMNHLLFNPDLSRQYWAQALFAFLIWAALVCAGFWVRTLLTSYAGSLVAYLSPYKDSKWDELRGKIQQVGLDAGNLIYQGYKLPSGWIPKYDRVVLLGHSLGSVIAYDTLNAMINIEAARNRSGVPNATG